MERKTHHLLVQKYFPVGNVFFMCKVEKELYLYTYIQEIISFQISIGNKFEVLPWNNKWISFGFAERIT